MNQYTINCTPEQTQKALELGAPIVILPYYEEFNGFPFVHCKNGNKYPCQIPTAEQLIGWLIDNGIHVEIEYSLLFEHYDICILDEDESVKQRTMFNDNFGLPSYSSRKEATLAAIDAALDYLIDKK